MRCRSRCAAISILKPGCVSCQPARKPGQAALSLPGPCGAAGFHPGLSQRQRQACSIRSGCAAPFTRRILRFLHPGNRPNQFSELERSVIGKFGDAKDQWFSSFMLRINDTCSFHRLFVDPLSRAMFSSKGDDFEFIRQCREQNMDNDAAD